MQRVPLIDLEPLLGGAPAGLARVAAEIGAAARDIGFFAVTNHGVPAAAVDALFGAAQTFFALPEAVKCETPIERSPHYLGYARMALEKLDPARPGDAKESFNMGREREPGDPDLRAGAQFVGTNQWPQLPGFRDALVAYFDRMLGVCAQLHRAIAIDLGLEPDYFAARYNRSLSALRVLHYPPHPGAFDGTLYGAGPHTDYGGITLLAQDDAGGLEVRRRDGTWIAVEPAPDTFVCNIGDAMMRWTNDIYVSNAHRVVNRSGRERYSAAFFYEPNPDALISCIPGCEGAGARYAPIPFADYLRSRLEPTYSVMVSAVEP
jgi:isopenicillin N synthase-like dioxygenase